MIILLIICINENFTVIAKWLCMVLKLLNNEFNRKLSTLVKSV